MKTGIMEHTANSSLTYYKLSLEDSGRLRNAMTSYVDEHQTEKKFDVDVNFHSYKWNDGYDFNISIDANNHRGIKRKSDTYADHYNKLRMIDGIMMELKQICDSILGVC